MGSSRCMFVAVAIVMTCTLSTSAQPLPKGLSEAARQRQYLDRVVTLEVTADGGLGKGLEIARGNGTIIDKTGTIITAKHVIRAFPEYTGHKYKAVRHLADGDREYELVAASIRESGEDAVTISIKNDGQMRFPYFCLQNSQLYVPSDLLMQSFYFKKGAWEYNPRPQKMILERRNGGDKSIYWSTSAQFSKSESGAGIFNDDLLVGVVATSVGQWDGDIFIPIPGHDNFVPIPLIFADLNLDQFKSGDCDHYPYDVKMDPLDEYQMDSLELRVVNGSDSVVLLEENILCYIDLGSTQHKINQDGFPDFSFLNGWSVGERNSFVSFQIKPNSPYGLRPQTFADAAWMPSDVWGLSVPGRGFLHCETHATDVHGTMVGNLEFGVAFETGNDHLLMAVVPGFTDSEPLMNELFFARQQFFGPVPLEGTSVPTTSEEVPYGAGGAALPHDDGDR